MTEQAFFENRKYIFAENMAGGRSAQDALNEAKKVYSDAAARSSASAANKSQSNSNSDTLVFSDVKPDDYGSEEIMRLHEKGVIQGYDDGTYKPQRTVNRAELNKLLIAGLHSAEAKNETGCFPDVKQEWFSTYVCAAKRLGWVSGYPDGSFMPANTVNRAEAIKIVVSFFDTEFR